MSARWSVFDAKTFGVDLPKNMPASIPERVYTSPIWHAPLKRRELNENPWSGGGPGAVVCVFCKA